MIRVEPKVGHSRVRLNFEKSGSGTTNQLCRKRETASSSSMVAHPRKNMLQSDPTRRTAACIHPQKFHSTGQEVARANPSQTRWPIPHPLLQQDYQPEFPVKVKLKRQSWNCSDVLMFLEAGCRYYSDMWMSSPEVDQEIEQCTV